MRRRGHTRQTAAVLASALAVGACHSATGLEAYRPEDYPPIKTVVLEGSFALEPLASTRFDLRVPETGSPDWVTLFATVDWTHSSNSVVASFAGEGCEGASAALASRCSIERSATTASLCPAKPRRLAESVRPGAFVSLYVANAGTSIESGRVQIVLCQDAPGCEEGKACHQCTMQEWDFTSCRDR